MEARLILAVDEAESLSEKKTQEESAQDDQLTGTAKIRGEKSKTQMVSPRGPEHIFKILKIYVIFGEGQGSMGIRHFSSAFDALTCKTILWRTKPQRN